MQAKAIAAALILIGAPVSAYADTTREKDSHPHTVHDAEAEEAARNASESEHHVYFRPFCRRARYVTNKSAPCWE
jgi:hypothetical protein